MYYKVLVKEKNYIKSHVMVVDACSKSDAREKVWEYFSKEWPTRVIERVTISSEWIWDVIL